MTETAENEATLLTKVWLLMSAKNARPRLQMLRR